MGTSMNVYVTCKCVFDPSINNNSFFFSLHNMHNIASHCKSPFICKNNNITTGSKTALFAIRVFIQRIQKTRARDESPFNIKKLKKNLLFPVVKDASFLIRFQNLHTEAANLVHAKN